MKIPIFMFEKYKLDNGLTILLVPNPSSQAVIVDAFVKVGSRHEEERLGGISHFLEHLNFKGTKNYPSARRLSEAIDLVGGVFNANTGREHTQYYAQVSSKHIGLAFDVVTDLFLYPLFKPAEIEREKGVIIEEINMYLDAPSRHVLDLVEEGMWINHPFGRNIAGKPDNIRAVTKQDILYYRDRFYSPENTIVAVAGNFNEADVKKLVKKYWSNYKQVHPISQPEPASSAMQQRCIHQTKPTQQAHFALGFRAYPRDDDKNHALAILSAVLGGGMSSRLFTEIRERRGLAYYVTASDEAYQDTGIFMARAGVEISKMADALQVMVKELSKVKKTALPGRDLVKAKEYWKGRVALQLEDTESKLGWYLEQLAFSKKIEEPKQWLKRLDQVTAAEVKKVANEVLQKDRLTLAFVGPYDDKKKKGFEKIISNL